MPIPNSVYKALSWYISVVNNIFQMYEGYLIPCYGCTMEASMWLEYNLLASSHNITYTICSFHSLTSQDSIILSDPTCRERFARGK